MPKLIENYKRNLLADDVREMNAFLQKNGLMKAMTDLAKPSLCQTLFTVIVDWAWVFASVALVYFYSLWWLPVALIVIGSRQRALVVLTHDASHYLLAKNRALNDLVANIFLCFPMVKSLKYYRAVHLPHHLNLGDEEHDSDYLHDPEAMKKGWLHVYLKHLLSYDLWIVAELKQMFEHISVRHMLYLALWWTTVISLLAASVGIGFAAAFLALWVASRVIMYHVITTFIIISDHHGLFPGTIMEYTRNHPSTGMMRWFIHPHNNGFHLAHHLASFVPFYNLNKARQLLKGWSRYDQAEQCETYFFGKKSVVLSWGKCLAEPYSPKPAIAAAAFEALGAIIHEQDDVVYAEGTGQTVGERRAKAV